MNVKQIVLTALSVFLMASAFAQDKIYKKNGEIIDAKVSVIGAENITFKKFNNQDGPEYSIPKADVLRIKYNNGTEDIFEENNDRIGIDSHNMSASDKKRNRERITVNNNIISVSPLEFTESGTGFGISYERYIDKAGWISLYLPVTASFRSSGNTTMGTPSYDPMFYFMPGIKMYTNLNSPKKAKFSLNPALVVATGRSSSYDGYVNQYGADVSRFMLGAIVNAGFNYFPAAHFYFGVDFGLGMSYLNNYNGLNSGFSGLTQLSCRVGYRFHGRGKLAAAQK